MVPKIVKEEVRNPGPAAHHPVQLTGAGLPGVTGRAVRKHVEWVIKLNTELALIRHHNMAERTVKGIWISQDNARIRSTAQFMEAWASGEIGLVVIRPAGSERGRESGHVITQSPSMEGDHVTTLAGENLDTAGNRDAQ